jgi:hypothetical protein
VEQFEPPRTSAAPTQHAELPGATGSRGPGFVIAGIVFSDNRLIGHSLIGVGVALAIVDNTLVRRRP